MKGTAAIQPGRASHEVRLAAWILFAILLCAGIATAFSYGQPWDEKVEIDILTSNMKEYATWAGLGETASFPAEEEPIPKISENIDRDHGMASYYLFYPIYLMTGFRTLETMYAWHIYTFLIFFAGTVALFLILKELFSKPLVWFCGTLSYFLTPRFFAEGHYNAVDLISVSLLLLTLYFLIRFSKTLKWKHVIFFSLFSGLLMNCRISGIALWAMEGFFAVLYQIIRKGRKSAWEQIVCGFVLSLLCYFVLTPAAWAHPDEFLMYCLGNAKDYDDGLWNRVILFNGNMIRPATEGLPYSYLPKWILMTVPEYVLALFAISCILFAARVVKWGGRLAQKRVAAQIGDREFFIGALMLLFWLPFAFLVYRAPSMVLYNGWRHCYFLYVPMVLCAMYALDALRKGSGWNRTRVGRTVLSVVLAIGLLFSATDIMRYHPCEYVYFNRVGRYLIDVTGFEGDYWNVSTLTMLRQFEETNYQGEKLRVALMVDAGGGQTAAIVNSDKLQVVEEEEADYYLFNASALWDKTMLEPYELISGLERDGYLISGVYSRKDTERTR